MLLPAFLGLALAAVIQPTGLDQAAVVAALAQAQPGDVVELPAGDYPLTSRLNVPSGVTLRGADRERCRLFYRGEQPDVVIALNGVEDVEVSNLTIDGELSGKVSQGVAGGNSRRLKLHHLTIQNIAKTGGWGPHGVLFSGVNPTCEKGVTDTVISDCRITNVGVGATYGGGVRLAWGSNRNQVLRNRIDQTGRGGIFGDHSTELIVRGNVITGSGGTGLGLELWGGCHRSVVEDNQVDHWLSIDGGEQTAVRRNRIGTDDGTLKGYGLEIIASRCVVTDNTVTAGAHIGLSVSNKPPKNDVFWAYNTVRECIQWGAQLQGEAGGIARHWFYRCSFEGMQAGHPAARYPTDSGHGFRTNGHCRDLVFEDCTFARNAGYGLQLGGSEVDRLTFLSCRIEGNRGPAVVGAPPTTEFTGCTVTGNRSDQLPASGGFATAPPRVTVAVPQTARVGETVTFEVTGDDLAQVLWDLGDSVPLVTPRAQHAFINKGKYRVSVIAWDRHGRGARVETQVEVSEP